MKTKTIMGSQERWSPCIAKTIANYLDGMCFFCVFFFEGLLLYQGKNVHFAPPFGRIYFTCSYLLQASNKQIQDYSQMIIEF